MTPFAIRIRPSVQAELDAACAAEVLGHFHTAFEHLERAHVLGQPATVEHLRVHWHMLRFALRNSIRRQVFGQLWRIAAAALFTPLGLVPQGNTGSASVSGFRRQALPADLKSLLDAARA